MFVLISFPPFFMVHIHHMSSLCVCVSERGAAGRLLGKLVQTGYLCTGRPHSTATAEHTAQHNAVQQAGSMSSY